MASGYNTSSAWGINKTDRFKIGQFEKKNIAMANVSPVSYERHLRDKREASKWSMGSKLIDIDKRVSPGPSVYDIPSKVVEAQGKTFGLKIEGLKDLTNTPGPGAYAQDKAKVDNAAYSMAAKLGDSKKLEVPGPGAYEFTKEHTLESVRSMKFGSGSRGAMELPNARKVPGPGEHSPDYRTLKKQSPRFGFGTQKRSDTSLERKKFIPGPGNYQLGGLTGAEGTKSSMHATIKYSSTDKEQSYKPGPGNYDPDQFRTKNKNPEYKIGTGQRLDIGFQKRQKYQQDPGSYNPDFAVTKNSASKWRFGTDTRKGVVNRDHKVFPGAGNYDIPSKLSDAPKYGMAEKLRSDQEASPMKNNPGPGQYDLQARDNLNMQKGQKYSIGNSTRTQVVAKSIALVPGPGNYSSSLFDKSKSPIYGFGTGGREIMNSTVKVPGPGQYELGQLTGREGPSSSMHNKLTYKPIQQTGGLTPGPGNYEAPLGQKRRSPAYGAGTEKRAFGSNKAMTAVPASNTYNPNATFTQKAASKWVFGTETRKGPGDVDRMKSPGPGNYQIEPLAFEHKKPRFHVGQKFSPRKPTTDVPGAGTYDPTPEKTKKQLPSYSMKLKLQGGAGSLGSDNKVPGPGNYEASLRNKQDAPKYGFGSSTRDVLRKLDVPGPGAYKLNSSIGDVAAYSMPNRQPEHKYV